MSKSDYTSRIRNSLGSFLARVDLIQITAFVCLIAGGTLFIYGTGQQVGTTLSAAFWVRQMQWATLSLGTWLLLGLIDYRHLKNLSWPLYFGTLAMLVAVLVIGIKVYGARRWLQLGPMRVQPSEFGKLAALLLTARIMTLPGFNINKLLHFAAVGVAVGIPFLLILVEPDLGTAMVLVPMTLTMIFVAGLRWRYIVIGFILMISLLTLEGLNEYYQIKPLLKDYQRQRIEVFLHPEKDIAHRGWNQLQAKLAVGSGGMSGKGFMQGTQNQLGFLPQTVSNTDFIFSVIAEETGFAGVTTLIVLYSMLIFSILRTALSAADKFGQYLACGTAAIIFMHTFVNIGMSIGLMPITGVPLPLVSYGGSFMMNIMIYLGIMQSIFARRRQISMREDA